MLVPVKFGEDQRYVKIDETEEVFILKVSLPLETQLYLTNGTGTQVDAHVSEDMLKTGNFTINVSAKRSTVELGLMPESDILSSEPSDTDSSSLVSDLRTTERNNGMQQSDAVQIAPKKNTMLVPIKCGQTQRYVRVAETEGGLDDFGTFIQKVIDKLGLPPETQLLLTNGTGTEVDADVFEDLLKTANLTTNVSAERSTVDFHWSPETDIPISDPLDASSPSPLSFVFSESDTTAVVRHNEGNRNDSEYESAKQMVKDVLLSKPLGQTITEYYNKSKTINDTTRKQLVNLW